MDEYVLVAVPFFIFMAQMLDVSGIAETLFQYHARLLGARTRRPRYRRPHGVRSVRGVNRSGRRHRSGHRTHWPSPNLLKRGYDIPMTAGAICAGGTLGILIPPSIMLVIYGSLTNISVGKLFAAAYLPGFMLATLYIIYVAIRCGLNPEMGPPLPA